MIRVHTHVHDTGNHAFTSVRLFKVNAGVNLVNAGKFPSDVVVYVNFSSKLEAADAIKACDTLHLPYRHSDESKSMSTAKNCNAFVFKACTVCTVGKADYAESVSCRS